MPRVTSARGFDEERRLRRRDAVVRLLRVEHAEAVVVLRREHDVLHPRVFRGLRPALRIELHRIERRLQRSRTPSCTSRSRPSIAPAPRLVLRAERPRLDDAPLGVGAPVHEQAELEVLPLVELLPNERIGIRDVRRPACPAARRRRIPADGVAATTTARTCAFRVISHLSIWSISAHFQRLGHRSALVRPRGPVPIPGPWHPHVSSSLLLNKNAPRHVQHHEERFRVQLNLPQPNRSRRAQALSSIAAGRVRMIPLIIR